MVQLPELKGLDFASAIQQFDRGRAVRDRRLEKQALADFGPGALRGDEGAIDQLFENNPQAAITLSGIRENRRATQTAEQQRADELKFRQGRAETQDAFNREKFDFDKTLAQANLAQKAADLNFRIAQDLRKPKGNPKRAQDLRKEFTGLSKDYRKVRDAFGRIRAVGTTPEPTGADDMALIFNFMKVLDPGSTVREGEFATAENTGGVDDKVRNIYNKILNGERLTDEQRSNFVGSATRLFTQQDAQQQRLFDTFERLAEKEGIDPNDVAIELGLVPDPAAAATPEPMQPGEQQTFGNVTIRRVN